jgi:hypothetical protein
MSELQFAIELSIYFLTFLVAIVFFVFINFIFARTSVKDRFNILGKYIGCFFLLLFTLFLPFIYVGVSSQFPFSIWSDDDAAICGLFWVLIMIPVFLIFNIILFVIFIIKILKGPKERELQTNSDFAGASSE